MSTQHPSQDSGNFCCQDLLNTAKTNQVVILRLIEAQDLDKEEVYAILISQILEIRDYSSIVHPRGYVFAILKHIIAQECDSRSFKRAFLDSYDEESFKCHQQIEVEGYRRYARSESLAIQLANLQNGLTTEITSYEQQVLTMYHIESMSFKQIGLKLNKSEDAVRRAASRARAKLKIYLKTG